MEVEIKLTTKVQAKTLKMHLKVCDEFYAKLLDQDGIVLRNYEGYVPGFMPGQHHGDYVMLDIDIDTGEILNWKQPTAQQMAEFINVAE